MEAWKKDRLTASGVDVDDALERFMGNEGLLERFLKRFLEDGNYAALCQAVENGDADMALTASHTMKGLCGNLSMKTLGELVTEQVTLLRSGDFSGAAALMDPIGMAYDAVAEAIRGCWT